MSKVPETVKFSLIRSAIDDSGFKSLRALIYGATIGGFKNESVLNKAFVFAFFMTWNMFT